MSILREAQESDLPGILEIQNEIILEGDAIYEEKPKSLTEFRQWYENRIRSGSPIIVAEHAHQIVGYGTLGEFRTRACYRHTAEISFHVSARMRRKGIGKALLQALVEEGERKNFHVLVAGVDSQNLGSLELLKKTGFQKVGEMPQIAKKFDRWLNLVFLQRILD